MPEAEEHPATPGNGSHRRRTREEDLETQVNQLRDVRVQFEKVSAENQRLQSLAKNAAKTDSKQSMQPVTIRIDNLTNRGLNSPEDAVQTFYWALRERNN